MENISNFPTAVAAQEGPSVSVVGDTYRIVIGSDQLQKARMKIYLLTDQYINLPMKQIKRHTYSVFRVYTNMETGINIRLIIKEKLRAL